MFSIENSPAYVSFFEANADVVVGMLRKVIFTVLAMALAWGLGNVLYEIWMSRNIHVPAGRGAPAADHSYSAEHAKFLFYFFMDASGAICGVLLTLGMGWMKKGRLWPT
ncbi:MAG: hypothetical protein E8A46_24000 [Bradyrhizobium sp.]|uniref:hypothetical protein n=1 Tax=Bradyrhizobium sp. TaxID=376 RepID=UPI001215660B|nr:hypothetical protein [Bradyrhizobium sp.]THD47515.1 MAG: hypothetical protein E8A46_24000 [Bradyrhizobium sp.]